jgi:CRISPR-associated exonuclease Cas4
MEDLLAISAIQHYAYCPRQFALIHVEQAWADNRFTAEGILLHQRVDAGDPEQRGKVRFERAVQLKSERLGLVGKLDLLEVEQTASGSEFRPVEYKRGKAKMQNWDRLQVCAQALCLEEMRGITVTEGAIWYWETRHREKIVIDSVLRKETEDAIHAAKELLSQGRTPPPVVDKKRCKACSLVDLCEPEAFRQDHSATYIRTIFES